MPFDDIAEQKRRLRAELTARRQAVPGPDRVRAAEAVARHGLAHAPLRAARVVAAYLPIGAELDPLPLASALAAAGATICLPVMAGKAAPLIFRAWSPGGALVARAWGIHEPLESARELTPQALLMPLLAFDAAGGRLGYGGGYYDRTLAALRAHSSVLAIGLAFDLQRVDAVPHLDYDQPMTLVLTPSGAHAALRP